MELNRWRILLVDDDEDDYVIVRQMLSEAREGKYVLEWESTFQAGLKTLLSCPPFDAVLVDYDMGAHTGIELVREAVAHSYPAPILLLTGRGTYEVDVQAMEAGAADYLSKGEVNPAFLERAIRYAMERKRSEMALRSSSEALRDSEDRYRTLFTTMLNGFALHEIICDADGAPLDYRFLEVNPAFEQMTGLKGAEILGRTVREVLPGIEDEWIEKYGHVALTREPIQFEDFAGPLGRYFQVYAFSPRVNQFATVFVDVTDRMHGEVALRESEARFRALFNNHHSVMLLLDPQTSQIIDANPAACTFYGWSFEEMLGKKITDINQLPPDSVQQKLYEAQVTPSSVSFEFQHRLASGEIRDVAVRSGPVEIGGKQMLFSIINDITENKRMERELAQSQDRNRAFFENLGAAAVVNEMVRDETGQIIDWTYLDANEQALQTLGYTREALLGRSGREVPGEPMASQAMALYAEVLKNRTALQQEESHADRKYLVSAFPINDNSVAVISVDITERRRAEERTRRHNAVLSGINRIFEQAITSPSEEELARRCLEVAQAVTGSPIGFTGDYNPQTGRLKTTALSDPDWADYRIADEGPAQAPAEGFALHGLYGQVLLDGKGFYTNEPPSLPGGEVLPTGHPALKAFLGVPLIYNGQTIGMVGLGNRAGGYGPDELEAAEALAPAIVQALYSKRAELAIRKSEAVLRASEAHLRKSEAHLRASEARLLEARERESWLARFPEENPNLVMRLSYEGSVLYYNSAARAIYPGLAINQVAPELLLKLALQAAEAGQKIEQDVLLEDKTFAIVAVPFSEDRYINLYGRNVTRRVQAEEAMREALNDAAFERSRLLAVMESLPVGVAIIDQQGGNVQSNRKFEEVWSGPRPVTQSIEDYGQYKAWWIDSGRPVEPEEWASAQAVRLGKTVVGQLLEIQRFDGQRAIVWNSAAPIRDAQGQVVGSAVAIMDITEQRRLEAQRSEAVTQMEIQHRLAEQREKDRQSIARDIHDGPVQTLSSTIFNLQFVKEAFPDAALRLELEQIALSVKSAVQELRQVINELRPPSLIRFGLSKTIQVHVEEMRERYPHIEWELKLENDSSRLAESTALVLFRIYQEAVNNIVRHSQASKAWVRFRLKKDQAILEIRDNGTGFPESHEFSHFIETGHFGLAGMKERAEAAGGHLAITCPPGKGTTIVAAVPLAR